MFRVGTRKPTASRTEGQNLVPLKTFIKNSEPCLGGSIFYLFLPVIRLVSITLSCRNLEELVIVESF
jgi:hypothetical protein